MEEQSRVERAAFIRHQISAARSEPFGSEARNAHQQAAALLKVHGESWVSHLPRGAVRAAHFERGFIAFVEVDVAGFSVLESVFDREPVRKLRLSRDPSAREGWAPLKPVFDLSQLQRIHRLELFSPDGFLYEDYEALTSSPNLNGLRELSVRSSPFSPPRLSALLEGPVLPHLESLKVADITNLGLALSTALPRAVHRSLKCLDLSGVTINSEQLQRLLASRCLKKVEKLRLGFSGRPGDLGPLFHLDIGWVVPWDQLVILDLAGQRLGDEAVKTVCERDEAKRLKWLGLANNELGSDSVQAICKSKKLSLNYLDVRGNHLPPGCVEALRARFPQAQIVT